MNIQVILEQLIALELEATDGQRKALAERYLGRTENDSHKNAGIKRSQLRHYRMKVVRAVAALGLTPSQYIL